MAARSRGDREKNQQKRRWEFFRGLSKVIKIDKKKKPSWKINNFLRIQSNNTARQWISEILRYVETYPADIRFVNCRKLLEERKF
ncbi:hypothetical protein H5U35_06230 [Candidatus Aerophobetes bacterium]|nr:hypothetical protein [Candidatus Aerophobetes bacterium]